MAQLKKGAIVRQIMPAPVVGTVERYEVDQETGELQVLVCWTCDEGHEHSTYFKADQVEEVKEDKK